MALPKDKAAVRSTKSRAPKATPEASRPRGRPRSVACHQAILHAAMALLGEFRYADVTMEGIAARAGVCKQTLYNWWPSKARLVVEAYVATAANRIPAPDTGSTEEDLRRLLCATCQTLGRDELSLGDLLAGLIADAQSDPELALEFRDTLIATRRAVAAAILTRGIERGEISADIDLPMILDLLYGPIWYRLLLRNAPLNRAFAHEIVAHIMPSLTPRPVPA